MLNTRIKKTNILIISVVFIIIALINTRCQIIAIPAKDIILERQFDFITISTVFAGFSFTMMGLILGVSSEALIEKIKNTDIILKRVNYVVLSIIMFIISVALSIILILGLDEALIELLVSSSVLESDALQIVESIIYILVIEYLIAGVIYFSISVMQFYDLILRIFRHNKQGQKDRIDKALRALDNKEKDVIEDDEDDLLQ